MRWCNHTVQFSIQFILSPIENYKSPAVFIIGPFVFCQGDGLVSSSAILDNYAFALSFLPLLPFPQVYSSIIVRNFSLAPFAWEKTPWHCFGHATCQHGWPWAFLRTSLKKKKHLGTAVKFSAQTTLERELWELGLFLKCVVVAAMALDRVNLIR